MNMTVKDLLKHDLPPTTADAKMRKKHTKGSIDHQKRHFGDHGDASVDQLKKLYTVDSKDAKKEGKGVLKEVDRVHKSVKDLLRSWK